MTEEEIEAIVKKLTWHGFERILDEPAEEIGDASILEEPALGAEDPTEGNVFDAVDATVEESEDVLDETVADENKIGATEDYDTSKETSAESIEEPEAPVLPEGNFESARPTEEAVDEQTEESPVTDTAEPKKIVIELPNSYLNEAELGRVRAIVASKAPVLKKALETDNLSIERVKRKKSASRGSLIMASMARRKHTCSSYLALQNEQKCSPGLQLRKARQTMTNLRCGFFSYL